MSDAKVVDTATLTIGDKTVELPILEGTDGPRVIDVRKLYAQTDMFTYDPSYTSTASCDSALTYIDGEEGEQLLPRSLLSPVAQGAAEPGADDRVRDDDHQSHHDP